MKPKTILFTCLLMTGLMIPSQDQEALAGVWEKQDSKYQRIKEHVLTHSVGKLEPNGKAVKIAEVQYKDNKSIDKS